MKWLSIAIISTYSTYNRLSRCRSRGMTEIDELHYPMKSRTLDRGALRMKNALATLRPWSGQWSAQEKSTGRKDTFKSMENRARSTEKECGEAPESCLPKVCTGLCSVTCARQGGYSSWPRSTCRNSEPVLILKSICTRHK